MKRYGVKEVFGTLQGEGAQAGSPAVFLRFAGCNLGYDVCPWCDTDWAKADYRVTAKELCELVDNCARDTFNRTGNGLLVVITGGEPSLQLDYALSAELRNRGYRLALETNGSRAIDRRLIDWLTVSPKQSQFIQKEGDELKVVFTGSVAPGIASTTDAVVRLAADTQFRHYFLQAVDIPVNGGPNFDETAAAVMRLGPPWRLSVQTHKVVGIQ